ncbi:hypothetical protein DIPPA_13470 [Diplonema papillatum]|nr:hypothetical protein DIPPA_13470 [Diplonema papillatum]
MSGMPSLVGAPILPGQQKLASASASRSGGFALDPLDTLDLGYDEEEEEIDDYDLARVSDEKKLSSGSKKKDKDKQGKKLAKADKDKKVKKKDKADKKRSHSGGETTTTTTGRSSSSKKSKTSGKDTKKKKPQQQQQQQPQKHQQRQTTGDQDTDTYSEDFAAQSNGSDEYTDQFAHDEPAPVVSQGGVKSGHASPRQSASLEAERKREEAAAYERKRLEWEARLRQQQQQQHGQEDETKQLKQRQSALAAAASSMHSALPHRHLSQNPPHSLYWDAKTFAPVVLASHFPAFHLVSFRSHDSLLNALFRTKPSDLLPQPLTLSWVPFCLPRTTPFWWVLASRFSPSRSRPLPWPPACLPCPPLSQPFQFPSS